MFYKKRILVGLLVILSSFNSASYTQEKIDNKTYVLNNVRWVFSEIQNMPLPKEWKFYFKNNEARVLAFIARELDEQEERSKQREKMKETGSLLKEMRSEISRTGKGYSYAKGIHECELNASWRGCSQECHKLAEYYREYLEYSAAFLIQEKIQSLDKQKTAHPNDIELTDFLQREKKQLEKKLKSISIYDRSKPGQSYYESLSEEKKKDLTRAIEEITKKEEKIDNYSSEFLLMHNVFKRK